MDSEIAMIAGVSVEVVRLHLINMTPLHTVFAVCSPSDNVSPIIERLLDEGCAIDDAAFINACAFGCNQNVILKMIDGGVNVNAVVKGATPITATLSMRVFIGIENCLRILDILIKNGADINMIPNQNCVPLGYATYNPDLLDKLLDFGADPVPFVMGIANIGKCFRTITSKWIIHPYDKQCILDKFWNLYNISLSSKTPLDLQSISNALNSDVNYDSVNDSEDQGIDDDFEDIDLCGDFADHSLLAI